MQELGCKIVPVFVAEGVESQLAGKNLVKRVSDLINEKSGQLCYLAAEGVLEEKLASGKAFKDEFEKLIQSLLAVSSSQLANKHCGTLFARDLRFPEAIKELQSTAFELAARAVAWAVQKQAEILVHIESVDVNDANPAELSVGSDVPNQQPGAIEQVRHEAFDPSI